MNIISEEKIVEECVLHLKNRIPDDTKYTSTFNNLTNRRSDSFRCGVQFAEAELQNLAVEFAKYVYKIGYESSLFIDEDLLRTFLNARK